MTELEEVTKELGIAYSRSKEWDGQKSEWRKRFFEAADKQHEVLAEKVVNIDAAAIDEAIAMAQKLYPTWTVLSATQTDEGFDVRLKEDPKYKPFTFVNPNDGMVYQKQVAAGAVMFDDERFKEDHPSIYEVITHIPEPKRELRPLDELSDEQIALIQDYVYEGKPVVKLAAPRKAKEDEL